MGVEVVDGAGLAEMLHPQRDGAVAEDAAEPAQGGRMGVDGGDEAGAVWNVGQQGFDMAACGVVAV